MDDFELLFQGKAIRELNEMRDAAFQKKLSIDDIAIKAHLRPSTVRNMLDGKYVPRYDVYLRLRFAIYGNQ